MDRLVHLLSMEINGQVRIGLTDEAHLYVIDLQKAHEAKGEESVWPTTLLEGIEIGEDFISIVASLRDWVFTQRNSKDYFIPMEEVRLLAPVPRPRKNIFCVGKNYREHVLEMGGEEDIPEHIMIFTKAPTTVIGHEEIIPLHEDVTGQLDYEGELAIVIGKSGKGIAKEDAMDYIFGYTIVNDVTARDLQKRHKQFFLGKSLDGTCPLGPVIVHKSAIDDPQSLKVKTLVNGEVRQSASTDQVIFSIPEIIATISKGMTLEPGDIIATGTPAGVGKGFDPPRFLTGGDVLEVCIEKIGVLRNTVK
ncbi:fumarylacetoacetate hydrolase family protein [Sutcliffiella horikoshii]|uniref:fumarylacetoacetate hydrolase family protein n=1 Tax=Sutcliffiella horikoshii TaxID=79883 RepID=UPI001CBDFFF2|nr:fumarylacetoacetate hydrolase family protein [Sutcliffiella horikoshii]UAL48582.1 fumarylacetoacetate hydrolase family protein [Sutcliffiella horikoshii]